MPRATIAAKEPKVEHGMHCGLTAGLPTPDRMPYLRHEILSDYPGNGRLVHRLRQ